MSVTKQKTEAKQEKWYTYRMVVTVETPIIAPALSPSKKMKELQIEDLKKCYPEEFHDELSHIDRAFVRNAECDAVLFGHVFSASLRLALNDESIVVRGMVRIPKENIRFTTTKAGDSLMTYEYVVPGTKVEAIVQVNREMPERVLVMLGARKFKGFGRAWLEFKPLLPKT